MIKTTEDIKEALHGRMRALWPSLPIRSGVFISSPGRVNLIGEHIDYNNCPVLPIAVDKRIVALVVAIPERSVKVADLDPRYESIEFSLEEYERLPEGLVQFKTGHWGNYIKAAVNELLSYSLKEGQERSVTNLSTGGDHVWECGFAMVFTSTIPQAAGMSSSSALVVLSTLALLEANDVSYSSFEQRLALADICRRAEWYVGTKGGGMDQAAILMGKNRNAIKISFNPIDAVLIPFEYDIAVVVAHSTVEAPKTREMMDAYNRRSIECTLAGLIVAKILQNRYDIEHIRYIGDITPSKTGLEQSVLDAIVTDVFHEEPYQIDEIASLLDMSTDQVNRRYCKRKDGTQFPMPIEGFKLYQRFYHVWKEWRRVERSEQLLIQGDIETFGTLMNDSHASCRDYHEVSCPELDMLTDIARSAGALGSRLTGAGFGGCAVSLVRPNDLAAFTETLLHDYYGRNMRLDRANAEHHIFVVHPSQGAGRIE